MRIAFKFLSLALAMIPMMTEGVVGATSTEAPKEKKSIVPSKYAGKYKGGGSDALAEFIKTHASGKDGFEFTAFFELCRKNGIAEDKVKHYADLVTAKAHGAEGRARMTLRNMLATFARKNGKLVDLSGKEHPIDLPKPVLTGAAAEAQAKAAEPTGTIGGAQIVGDDDKPDPAANVGEDA